GVDRVARLVGVMRADGVGHDLGLAEAARVVGADDRVRAVDGVGARLADVVHERGAARELDVEAELVGHHAAEERGLDGVLPLVLRVRGAPVEPPDELDDVGVRARDLELLEGAAAELDHLALEVFLDLLDGDARLALPGAVLLELADGAAGDLAAERVLPFEAHRRLIVGERERDVRDFLDDRQVGHEARAEAGRQKEVRLQPLGQVVALVALDGDAHDALGFAAMLGVGERLIDAAQLVGGARLGVGDPLADEAVAELAAGFAGDLLEAANDVLLDAATGVVVLATGGFELLEALLALVDGGGAGDHARLLGGEGELAARELVLAALQFALGLVRLVLRHAAGVEELLLGFGRGGTDGGGRFGLAGGGDGGDFGGEGLLAQAGVEELPPAHHGKGAAAENQRGDYIKEEHVTSLQAPAGFGKARPRRQPSSPIWPPPLRTSRRPSSISPAFPSGRATSISTTARSITAGLTARASTSTFVAAQLSLRCSPRAPKAGFRRVYVFLTQRPEFHRGLVRT